MADNLTTIPGLRAGRTSVSDGDTITTGLSVVNSFVGTATTAGGIVGKTSVSGGVVTISLKTHAGSAISSDENIDWFAYGND